MLLSHQRDRFCHTHDHDPKITYSQPMLVAVPLLLLVLMLGTAVPAWRGDRSAAFALALEGVVWLLADKWFEGPLLVRFADDHGLVLADLVGLAALFGAAVCMLRARVLDRTC
jgi:hypothetical protein